MIVLGNGMVIRVYAGRLYVACGYQQAEMMEYFR